MSWSGQKASFTNKSILESLNPNQPTEPPNSRMLNTIIGLGSIGGLLFGYDTGIISGALVLLTAEFNLSEVQQELVVGICIAGAFVSGAGAGWLSDRFGRRSVVLGSSVAFIMGSVLLCLANNIWLLYFGRFVVGLGVGSASMIVPMLLSECSPAASRGAVVTCVNVAITFGQLFACVTAALLQPYEGSWRIMLGLAALPAVVQFVGFWLYIPESPRWLCRQGHVDMGTLALRQLRDAYDVRVELGEILDSLRAERDALETEFAAGVIGGVHEVEGGAATAPPSYRGQKSEVVSPMSLNSSAGGGGGGLAEGGGPASSGSALLRPPLRVMLRKPSIYRPLLVGVILQVTQQLAGINTVMYYSATIFTSTGVVSQTTAIWLALGTAACNFVGSMVGQRLTDSIGRRKLTLGSLLAVVAALLAIAAAFQFSGLVVDVSTASDSSSSGRRLSLDASSSSGADPLKTDAQTFQIWTIFATICVYLLVFSPGLGSVPWTICSEIFPSSCRGVATSVTTSANWAANFLVSVSFLSCVRVLGAAGTFLMSACLSSALGLWLYCYLPETRGVALEEVPVLFSDGVWGAGTSLPRQAGQCCECVLGTCCGCCCSAETALNPQESTRPRGLSRGFFYSSLGPELRVGEDSEELSSRSSGEIEEYTGDPTAAAASRIRRQSIKL